MSKNSQTYFKHVHRNINMFGRFSKSMMKKIFFCSARHGVIPRKFEIFSGNSNNYSKIKASLTFRIKACVRYFLSNFHFFIKWYFFIKGFWRAIIWWKNKNLMKIADTSFKFNQWFLWSPVSIPQAVSSTTFARAPWHWVFCDLSSDITPICLISWAVSTLKYTR